MSGTRLDGSNPAGPDFAIRDLYWKPWDAPGCEHVRVSMSAGSKKQKDAVVADGLVLLYRDARALRCHYRLIADAGWRARSLDLVVQTGGHEPRETCLSLSGDGKGHWRIDGAPAPGLDGCLDLDIQVTPFTNSLPIRRLDLAPGEIADIRAVYVPLPGLVPVPAEQSYACLRPLGRSGGLFRYNSRSSGFSADLPVDSGGFVVDYPDSFRRIW